MAYQVVSGEVQSGVLYMIVGDQSVTYNAITYTTGQRFRGVAGVRFFTYSGTGAQEVNEILELVGGGIELVENLIDQPAYADITQLNGMGIEFSLNDAEKIVNEVTKITGFALELIDYPFYSWPITETRL
ncbi:hypothetical protein [Mucilaginibacter sp.]|uniref:hypothetical protein n=1 Tax=Mucilaginibacter sp. TaxID=1882438 RepID=UPI00261E2BD6|nr:hypothetical protein [Mucilaginibacter sp.]MDB4918774.1 hypothetical protein [Mucilaginibacter sp.]